MEQDTAAVMVDMCSWKFLKVLFPFSFNVLLGKKRFCIVT